MSIAVCIACGEQKHGALTPCGRCGFEPASPIDRAKSCMLTNLQLSTEEFAKVGAIIRTGQLVNYDSVSLASLYVRFLDEAYFSSSLDLANGVLPCRRCRKLFQPVLEEVHCPSCAANIAPALAPCTQCRVLYDSAAKYCQKCGLALSPNPDLTTKDVGVSMALCVRRAVKSGELLKHSQYLSALQHALNDDQRAASNFELETLGMYIEIVTLSKYMLLKQLLVKTVHEMVELCRQAFILEGASEESADLATSLRTRRFDEYDTVVATDPERWMLFLGNAAAKNCVGAGEHIGIVMEMDVVIGYFAKVFESTLLAVAFRR